MKNNIIRIEGLSLLFLIPFLLISGCGNKKKIRLHAPDSSVQRLSGRWVLTDSSEQKKSNTTGVAEPFTIARLELNENHSANIYRSGLMTKERAVAGSWELKKLKAGKEITSNETSVILVTDSNGLDTVRFNIVTDQRNGDTILSSPNHFSYRKDK